MKSVLKFIGYIGDFMNCSILKTQKNSLRKFLICSLLCLFSAFGWSVTWKGTVSSDWTDGANWDGGTAPANSTTIVVVIDKEGEFDPVLSNDITLGKLTINAGNKLDAKSYKLTIATEFTCYGTYAVQIDNPQPLGPSSLSPTSYITGTQMSWKAGSYLELDEPAAVPADGICSESSGSELFYSDGTYKYINLYVNLPGKTYKPVKGYLWVTNNVKLNCSKVLVENGNQDYEGEVLLESDVDFESTGSDKGVYFRKKVTDQPGGTPILIGNRGHLLSEQDASGNYLHSATINCEKSTMDGEVGLKTFTVNSELTINGSNADTVNIVTTGKQIYNESVIFISTLTSVKRDFTATEIDIKHTWVNSNNSAELIFKAPVNFYEDTTINCMAADFEKTVDAKNANLTLTVNGSSGNIEFYGNAGVTNKFKKIISSGSKLKVGKAADTIKINIKADTFSYEEEFDSTADLYGNITADKIIIKAETVNLGNITLTADTSIELGDVVKVVQEPTLIAGESVTFDGNVVGNKKLTLNSKDSSSATFTFSNYLGYTGTLSNKQVNSLDELSVNKGKVYFNNEVNINKPFAQTDDTEYYFKASVVQNDTTGDSNTFNGKVNFTNTTTAPVTFDFKRPVVFGNDSSDTNKFESTTANLITIKTNNNDITFNSKFNCASLNVQKLTVNAGTGNVSINNSLGTSGAYLADVNISAKNVTVAGGICGAAINIDVAELYEQKAGSEVRSLENGTQFTQTASNANAKVVLAGLLESNGITFNSEVFVNGTASIELSMGRLDFKKNVYIASSGNVNISCSSNNLSGILAEENFILCKGALSFNGNLTVKKDLLLLGNAGSGNSNQYSDACGEATDLYSYFNANRSGKPYTLNVIALPTVFPGAAGTAFPPKTEWNATMSGFAGKTITVEKNFYDNGVSLNPSSSWTLKIPGNAANEFIAEIYNATVKNATLSSASSFAKVAAAENVVNDGGNTNPTKNNPKGFDFEPLTISSAYTVNDDILYIEFTQAVENSNNELNGIFEKITYDNGTKAFAGVYKNAACTEALPTDTDVTSFYLKAAAGQANRWNTDATGTSAGNEQSTDKGRTGEVPVHSTVIPDITIEKATAALFETLRDDAKNRIKLYKGDTRYTGTTDKCAPVLIAVYTGQELHTPYGSSAASQPQYDAHNFIEFQYSEQINAGTAVTENSVNVQATSDLGEIVPRSTETGTDGITVKGLATLEHGKVVCGERNDTLTYEEKTTVHSVYRKFKQTAADTSDVAQTHRMRVAVAGYVDGTITVDGKTYNNWKGYIKNAQMPSGAVTRIANESVKDASGNVLDSTGDAQHVLPQITVNATNNYTSGLSADNTLYGTWDLSRPQFAVWFNPDQPWSDGVTLYKNEGGATGFEIVGSTGSSTGTEAKCIEFHVFDNTNNYSAASPNYIPKNGWADAGKNIIEYAYDVTGGSRQQIGLTGSSAKPNRTGGGLRRSSLENADKAFKYKLDEEDDSKMRSAGTKAFVQYAYSELLHYAKDSTLSTACPSADSLYFEVFLTDADQAKGLSVSQVFNVEFIQDNCFMTDLAGNLLCGPENAVMTSLNFTPPQFALSIAAVGKNEVFILFSKKLGATILSDLVKLRNNLELVTMDESKRLSSTASHPASGLAFDTEAVPQQIFTNSSVTCLKFKLNQNVTLADIKDTWVRVKQATEQALDNQTGLMAYISPIQDGMGNAMTEYSCHALSDFAVNAVKPLNAYAQTVNNTDPDNPVTITLNTITSFKPEDSRNDLPTESDIFMQANITDSSNKAIAFFSSADSRPVAEQFKRQTGKDIRVWLPVAIPSFTDKAATPDVPAGVLSSAPDASSNIKFEIKNSDFNWLPGKNVQFIFGIANSDGTLVKIDNDGSSSTDKIPLYALRLKDESDITSLDLWQFKTLGVQKQRGGVIIRNNVINASKNEKTIIQIDMPETDDIKVAVMTVGGSIVTYLHNGSLNRGMTLLEWDGKNKAGNFVARGLYFIRVSGAGIDETRKVIVVK